MRNLFMALLALLGLSAGASMPSFDGGSRWIGSQPLTPASLRGKVVLVDFWEYTCINCLRTLPYLTEWYKRYANDGFVVVGVQTPEFGFSGNATNVEQAIKRLGITWPVVVDKNDTIWNRFGANAWPTELLFDQQGNLVHQSVGEGGYQQTEREIQGLLKAQNPHLQLPAPMALLARDSYTKPGAVCYPQTPEVLVGHQFAADPSIFAAQTMNGDQEYHDSSNHQDGRVYLSGRWQITHQAVITDDDRGQFAMRYHAIQVMVVMTPAHGAVRVDVQQDGKPIAHGDAGPDITYDASGNSYVQVDQPRAYDLLANQAFGNHELTLSPKGSDLGIYDVAFESCEVPSAK